MGPVNDCSESYMAYLVYHKFNFKYALPCEEFVIKIRATFQIIKTISPLRVDRVLRVGRIPPSLRSRRSRRHHQCHLRRPQPWSLRQDLARPSPVSGEHYPAPRRKLLRATLLPDWHSHRGTGTADRVCRHGGEVISHGVL